MSDSKKRLFEMMSKLDNSFKRPLNEGINGEINEGKENIVRSKHGHKTIDKPIIPDAIEIIKNSDYKTFEDKDSYKEYLRQQNYFSLSNSHSFYSPEEYEQWSENGNISNNDSKNSEIVFNTGREVVGVWDDKNNIGYVKTKNDKEQFNEARYEPKNYHETLGAAIDDAVEMAESMGYQVDHDEIMSQLGTGGVGYGETKRASISLYKDGKEQRKALQIIVYRMETGKYELTAYIG